MPPFRVPPEFRDQTSNSHASKKDKCGTLLALIERIDATAFLDSFYSKRLSDVKPAPGISIAACWNVGHARYNRLRNELPPGVLALKWVPHEDADLHDIQRKHRCRCTVHNLPCVQSCEGWNCFCVVPNGETSGRCIDHIER